MKGNRIDAATDGELRREEELCRIAGDLVERAVPGGRPALTAAQRDRLQAALAGQHAGSPGGSRRRFLVPALASLALVIAGGVAARALLFARPIRFAVVGADVGPGGWIETAAARPATVRFSDGTWVRLGGASAARVTEPTPDGATFTVERGRARFEVVHRARAHWTVAAGPFEILVTGTAFDVDWSGEHGHALIVDLQAGSVIVRGSLAGAGIPLRAGQRLVADLDRSALVVSGEPAAPRAGEAAVAPPPGEAAASVPGEALPPSAPALESPPGPGAPVGPAADPGARADRTRSPRAGGPASSSPTRGAPEEPQPSPLGPARAPAGAATRAWLEPEPWPVPLPLSGANVNLGGSKLAAGGSACLGWAPQVRFDWPLDRLPERVEAASALALAFSHPVVDRGRSWCGAGSLRVEARFDLAGASNRLGHRPRHAGEVLVDLAAPTDLTGKTVTVHFFVEGPPYIRFGAQLFAIDRPGAGDPKWVGGGYTPDLTTGRWWTLSHTFARDNPLFEGGTSPVDRVEKLTLQVYAIGKDRIWTGRVFVDDLGWQ